MKQKVFFLFVFLYSCLGVYLSSNILAYPIADEYAISYVSHANGGIVLTTVSGFEYYAVNMGFCLVSLFILCYSLFYVVRREKR